MPDDIAYWRSERDKLAAQLQELETEAIPMDALAMIRYLKARIQDIERHIKALES